MSVPHVTDSEGTWFSQPEITCSELAIETLEQGVKCV